MFNGGAYSSKLSVTLDDSVMGTVHLWNVLYHRSQITEFIPRLGHRTVSENGSLLVAYHVRLCVNTNLSLLLGFALGPCSPKVSVITRLFPSDGLEKICREPPIRGAAGEYEVRPPEYPT